MTERKLCSHEFNIHSGLQPTHKWIVLLNDGRCVAIVKTSNIIHVLYIKPAFGHFHLRWSYETQRSICITFQKVYCKPVHSEGFQNGHKAAFRLETETEKEHLFLKVVPQALTFQKRYRSLHTAQTFSYNYSYLVSTPLTNRSSLKDFSN